MRYHCSLKTHPLFFIAAITLVACAEPAPQEDGGPGDADQTTDADDVSDADVDLDADDDDDDDVEHDADVDADIDEDIGEPSPPAEILSLGSAGLLLRGTVLTPTGVIDPGEVLVIDAIIECVAEDCSSATGADEATVIETHGIISPGLIDAHNHIAYDFLPEWVPNPPRLFDTRYEWADDPDYEAHIEPYAAHRSSNSHFCPGAKWGELRALVHGATTIQGHPSAQGSCINWGIRNTNRYHGLGYDHMGQRIASVRDINDDDATSLVENFEDPSEPWTRYHVHMSEGIGGVVLDEFDSYAGRDSRDNRHQGVNLLDYGTTILIHSVPLTADQLNEVERTGSMIVWSPSSNIVLYGQTAPIDEILERDIVVGLGPDWTPSGEDEMLSELRYALDYGRSIDSPNIDAQRLWEMATFDGAEVVGLEDYIGQLTPGYHADITVFGRRGGDPYETLIASRAADVRLVLIDGVAFYGDANLEQATARNEYCEPLEACGSEKFICVQDSPDADRFRDETLDDIYGQLYDILEGTPSSPPEEQYGRGDELLELVDCSI